MNQPLDCVQTPQRIDGLIAYLEISFQSCDGGDQAAILPEDVQLCGIENLLPLPTRQMTINTFSSWGFVDIGPLKVSLLGRLIFGEASLLLKSKPSLSTVWST